MKKLSYNHSLKPITLLSTMSPNRSKLFAKTALSCNYTRTVHSLKKTKISSIRAGWNDNHLSPTHLKTPIVLLDCLQGRPNCQKFRKDSIWGIEFFDPIFAFPEDPISFYLDADILFLRPFSGLFDRNQVKGGAIFLKDTQWDAYCFRPWQMLTGKKGLK